MLNQITPLRTADQPSEDAVDLLVGCHRRIRHFTATAVKLARAPAALPAEVRLTAFNVHRYYSISLPLHEDDEDFTLRPRLDAVVGERVRRALAAMHDQHLAIGELLERLLPLLLLVERNPEALQEVGCEMAPITKALEDSFGVHLQLEEEVIFPAIRNFLPENVRAEILEEMKARRQERS